jgi:hypothetical protein
MFMRNAIAAAIGVVALVLGGVGTAPAQTQNPLLTPARPPRDPNAVDLKGTAVVRGRVTSLDTGKPLRRAQVTLNSPELGGQPKTASTTTDGRFEIRDVPAGRYTLRVNRSGYLPLAYGQRRPGEPGKPFEIADKQVVEKVDFALPRMGVISGRVMDELGEPIAGVTVFPMQLQYFQGARKLVPNGGAVRTDDTGQYRLLALPPGDFVVMATIRETWPLEDDPKQIMGYAPSYYPTTASPADAQRVKVGVGQEVANIDFSLVPGRTAKLSGTAMTADGVAAAGDSVGLSQEITGPQMSSMMSVGNTKVASDGTWSLTNIPVGEYRLTLRVAGRDGQPGQEAQQMVAVQGADLEGISLMAGAGGTIRGLVATDDGSPLPPNLDRLIVRHTSLTGNRFMTSLLPDNGRVNAQGLFELKGVFGQGLVSIGALTGDWVLKAVDVEGRDVADDPIEVPHGGTLSVRVVLSQRPSYVRGSLIDEKRQPAEGTVIVFAEESSRWRESGRSVRSTRPDQNGEFSIKGLPPGNYLAVALGYVQDGQWNDPEFLEGLKPRAERLTLAEAETKRIALTVVNQR